MDTSSRADHALVIGGSIAGLLAARVLTNHFDRVTVVDRDRFPTEPGHRAGAPQAFHLHVLLMRGQQIVEQLFPGLQDELAAAGAPLVDWSADCLWFMGNEYAPRARSGFSGRSCSRDLLEWSLRSRLSENVRVRFAQECEVVGLLADAGKTRVTGVRVRSRETATTGELPADLVVDASGRESRAPEWLETLGYPKPRETIINSFLGYASRFFQRPANSGFDWKGLLIRPTPPGTHRGAVILPIEGDQMLVTLGAAGGDYPPTDEEGFNEFARSLPSPLCYDAIRSAQPASPIHGYRRTENRLRHYEHLSRMPERLVLLGDSVCAFNPVYGQGMTAAALGATVLDESLGEHKDPDLHGLPLLFQKRLAKVNNVAWLMATSADFLYPQTEGGKPDARTRLIHRYMNQVMQLAFERLDVQHEFIQVSHLLKPPGALFHPLILARVLSRTLRPRRRAEEKNRSQSLPLSRSRTY